MEKSDLQSDVLFYALGAIGLGAVCLFFGELARPWQPVPAWMPFRTPLTYFCAVLILGAGVAALTKRWRLCGVVGLAVIFGLWALLLKTPVILSAPAVLGAWLGFAEAISLAIAALMAATSMSGIGRQAVFGSLRIGYGLCVIIFGLCHYAYVDITASMVPDWLPERQFWVYLTGTGHIAAGIALSAGVMVALAARMLGVMMGSFVLLVHLPDTIAQPGGLTPWTIQFIALLLAGGAWLVGGVLARDAETSPPSRLHSALLAIASRRPRDI